ncbi:MAG: 50S ribosomal protein L1 [Spirochaetes bacterium]|nr:50S ribosomal protein L1 [Spirochaetota bacterium]
MKKHSKRFKALAPNSAILTIEEAVGLVKKGATAKFDESVDVSVALKLEKKHTIRDTVSFPNAFGKSKTVLVFAKGKKAEEAKAAGADFVGDDDLIEKINGNWTGFDVAIATPDMMKSIAKVARVLGTKGLMPNPKAKTVTDDVTTAVKEVKAGRREFRADAAGIINFSIGKASMGEQQLVDNFKVFFDIVLKKKPSDLKGDYVRSVHVTSSMGKSVQLNKKSPSKAA